MSREIDSFPSGAVFGPHSESSSYIYEQRNPEQTAPVQQQIGEYFATLRTNLNFDPIAVNNAYSNEGLIQPQAEISDRAEEVTRRAVDRSNKMANIITSPLFKETQERQREMRGDCATGKIVCIDGRIATAHTSGTIEGVHEPMGGCVDTSISTLTGNIEIKSQTLDRAIEERPKQVANQILEIDLAHGEITYDGNGRLEIKSNCGAMQKFQADALDQGKPFSSDDLIQENFRLMEPSIQAMSRKYNAAAEAIGKSTLEKVVIRGVFDTKTQGTLFGYGDKQPPFFTSAMLEQLEPEMLLDLRDDPRLRDPGYFRQSFTQIDRFLDKEQRTTDLIEYFMGNSTFRRSVKSATHSLSELQGLTDQQEQALAFSLSKNMSFQWLTGLYKRELSSTHPFSNHNEQYQAITVDDGYGATVGRNDPEVQIFTANTATLPEAIDHVKVKISLMDHYSETKPYVLFVCSGIAESAADNHDVRKQAIATVGRTFRGITQNPDIANKILSGVLIPVPAVVTSRSNRVIEIPNLLR